MRHAGVMYALATIKESFPEPKIDRAIVETAYWLKNQIGSLNGENDSIKVLWFTSSSGTTHADLGGAGLGLLALVKALEIDSSLIAVEELEKIAAFIEFMQKPDGSFFSKYEYGKGVNKKAYCEYYPGEAILGLMALYGHTNNSEWFQVALKAMRHLARSRETLAIEDMPADHWVLISTPELLKSSPVSEQDRRLFIQQAQKVSCDNSVCLSFRNLDCCIDLCFRLAVK